MTKKQKQSIWKTIWHLQIDAAFFYEIGDETKMYDRLFLAEQYKSLLEA